MNYIHHLNAFFEKAASDPNLNPTHLSLYLALFQLWNLQHFRNPMSICRSQLLFLSKIGSKTTYHKCLQELHQGTYLTYHPSHNPLRGSVVTMNHLYCDSSNLELVGSPLSHSVSKNTSLSLPKIGHALVSSTKEINKKEKERLEDASILNIPTLEEVTNYFETQKVSVSMATEYYDYYTKKHWKTKNGETIKSWRHLALKWITTSLSKDNNLTDHSIKINPPLTPLNYYEPL